METAHDPKEFAFRWNEEVWENRNLDAIEDLVADDFVSHNPSLPSPVRGPDGVRAFVERVFAAFPDMTVDVEDVVAGDDRIAQRLRCTGTHEGEYLGLEPTGREVTMTVSGMQYLEAGTLAEEWEIADHLDMLAQLGVFDPPSLPDQPVAEPTDGQDDQEATPRESVEASTAADDAERLVRRIPEEVANQGDLGAVDGIFATDAIDESPLGPVQGRDAIKAQFEQLLAGFGGVSVTVDDVFASGNRVADRVTWRATHDGPFMGIEPTGQRVEFRVIELNRVRGGRIVERWIHPDQFALMSQLGVVEPPTP